MIRLNIPLRSRGYVLTREEVIKWYFQEKLSSRDIAAKISRSKYYVDSRIKQLVLNLEIIQNLRLLLMAYHSMNPFLSIEPKYGVCRWDFIC